MEGDREKRRHTKKATKSRTTQRGDRCTEMERRQNKLSWTGEQDHMACVPFLSGQRQDVTTPDRGLEMQTVGLAKLRAMGATCVLLRHTRVQMPAPPVCGLELLRARARERFSWAQSCASVWDQRIPRCVRVWGVPVCPRG